jgi:CP family cyanate transporter-like MFS transporter
MPAVLALLIWIPQMLRSPGRLKTGHEVANAPSERGAPTFPKLLRDSRRHRGDLVHRHPEHELLCRAHLDPYSLAGRWHGRARCRLDARLLRIRWHDRLTRCPLLAKRTRPAWLPVLLSAAFTGVAYLGLALAPIDYSYAWMTLLGIGQGASMSLSLSYIVWRSPDARHTGHLSTIAQGIGYLLAGLGPIGLGALHSGTEDWTLPLVALGALLALQLISGTFASRERHVLDTRNGSL